MNNTVGLLASPSLSPRDVDLRTLRLSPVTQLDSLSQPRREWATLPLPELAKLHLDQVPFQAPVNVKDCTLWYEGTFDPLGPHHWEIFRDTMDLGFERGVLAICFQNPLKPKSTEFKHRVGMARAVLEAEGFPIAERFGDKGIYIETHYPSFHHQKLAAWFDPKTYHLMGPDNFQTYYHENVCWAHDPAFRENQAAREFFQFRNLYNQTLKERVLVFPILHDIHATDIRMGTVPPHPAVGRYLDENGLKLTGQTSAPGAKTARPADARPVSISIERVRAEGELLTEIEVLLAGARLATPRVMSTLEKFLTSLDRSELGELKTILSSTLDEGAVNSESAATKYHKPNKVARDLRHSLMSSLIGSSLSVEGVEPLLDLQRQGKKLIFVSMHADNADAALIPFALRHAGASAIADKLTFVVGEEIRESQLHQLLLAQTGGIIEMIHQREADAANSPLVAKPGASIYQHAMKRVSKGDFPVFFPEGAAQSGGMGMFGHGFLTGIIQAENTTRTWSANDLYIVPVAHRGSGNLLGGGNSRFSEEMPLLVNFGEPIPFTDVRAAAQAEGPAVASHLLAFKVAALVPQEFRGCYGSEALNETCVLHLDEDWSADDTKALIRSLELLSGNLVH